MSLGSKSLRLWLLGDLTAGYDSTSPYRYLSPGDYLIMTSQVRISVLGVCPVRFLGTYRSVGCIACQKQHPTCQPAPLPQIPTLQTPRSISSQHQLSPQSTTSTPPSQPKQPAYPTPSQPSQTTSSAPPPASPTKSSSSEAKLSP